MQKTKHNETKQNSSEQHKAFIKHYYSHSNIPTRQSKVSRAIKIVERGNDVKDVEFDEIGILSRAITLYPEALAYLYRLEGCEKKLFLYLLFIHLDRQTGEVKFNASVLDEFKSFCTLFGDTYTDESIRQAIKELRDKNVLYSMRKGLNLVNPLITAKNDATRATLVKNYSSHLVSEGLSVEDDFLPVYK